MYYLYIRHSQKDNNFYTGTTTDLKRRITEHNQGKNFSTASRRPFKLIYYEAYLLKEDAEARERYLKTSMGRRVIRKQLENYLKKHKLGSKFSKAPQQGKFGVYNH
jgi:putative endonuclease